MNIAIIAHDVKKELMTQFCIAYAGILSQHNLCATGTTGKVVSEATGLKIQSFLSGDQGGEQQIASRVACNEIDLLLMFGDPLNPKPMEPIEADLLRLCPHPFPRPRRPRLERHRQSEKAGSRCGSRRSGRVNRDTFF